MLIVLLRIILNIEGSVNISFDYVYPVKFISYRYMVLRGAHPVRVNFQILISNMKKLCHFAYVRYGGILI